ncbi:chemotaxis protein CheB [Sphingomonas sp. KR1UV-12]|uniref:protein-glutamate methylesterase n=1 Tax=Sphingomonas aurea TaxID=3063994 RepID=A0ABT9EGC2_9SPHN|nr:chemotaxis protein CheB [Sphingomonas sp. KR1UV-12]MDP1026022.1 chemotaxis protein CheB [Sphingomonas sp. KR1UV-12]
MLARSFAIDASAPRVLIVDDSVVARTVIARVVESCGRFAIAGVVGTAQAALDFVADERVDLILLDIAMPGMDGLTALPDLLAIGHGARIIIVSTSAVRGASETVRALALGAADTVEKPAAAHMSGEFARALIGSMDRLVAGRLPEPLAPVLRPVIRQPVDAGAFDVVLIGASTGGIHALSIVLRDLPVTLSQPIVITQHLPAAFMPYFTAQLATITGRPCTIATDCMRLKPRHILVAPGDAHIRCVSTGEGAGAVRLTRERAPTGCLPAVDPMFASAAEAFGARTLAIVLSGMGKDGAEGARLIHEAGGCVVVQDEQSSVVWGMPGAVVGMGLADAVMPPEGIARLLMTGRRA